MLVMTIEAQSTKNYYANFESVVRGNLIILIALINRLLLSLFLFSVFFFIKV